MILVTCPRCLTAVRVMGEPAEVDSLVGKNSEFWSDRYTCVSCGAARCEGLPEGDIDPEDLPKLKIRELSPQEMYAAQMGLGTPDEMQCDAATVRSLLSGKPLKAVHGFTVPNTTRFCLTELETEDGTKLHLGASPHGAVVYRISRPFSYARNVLEEVDRG